MSIIYGPVPSWRLKRSLGIDMVCTKGKTCSFDCVYCQLGDTLNKEACRSEFVTIDSLQKELELLPPVEADYATFSGVGEPTLAANLGKAIETVRSSLQIPVAVLTNSSLLYDKSVRGDLAGADTVVAKLDAADDDMLRRLNRPVFSLSVHQIIDGLKAFRYIFSGKLAIQIMFIQINREKAAELASLVKELAPDEIQINTPLRPCAIKPLDPADLSQISSHFSGLKSVITVYEAEKRAVAPLDRQQTERRRPEAKQT